MENKKKSYLKYVIIGVILIVGACSFFGGGYVSNKKSKAYMESVIDSLTQLSQKKQDSLIVKLQESELITIEQGLIIEDLNRRNYNLYATIKQKEIDIERDRDTVFISNARRISNGVNRLHSGNDNLR